MTVIDKKNADDFMEDHTASDAEESVKEENAEEADAPEKEIDPVEDLEARLEASLAEKKAAQDQLLRAAAEFENYKKRYAREKDEFRKYAVESIIKELLPVIDNLERAISSSNGAEADAESHVKSIVEGVEMTLSGILKVFEKYNVKPIKAEGEPFDPGFHQAVAQEESDKHAENTVLKELQKGYTMHDRLVRPSMVVVSKAKK